MPRTWSQGQERGLKVKNMVLRPRTWSQRPRNRSQGQEHGLKAKNLNCDKYKTVAMLRFALGLIKLKPNRVGKVGGCLIIAGDVWSEIVTFLLHSKIVARIVSRTTCESKPRTRLTGLDDPPGQGLDLKDFLSAMRC